MKIEFKTFLPLLILPIILAFLGYYILYPVPLKFDPSMHAEIVNIISIQGYPNTWQPYANNTFTYTPLFHYLSYIPSVFGLSPVDSVMILGILIYMLIPISTYYLVLSFKKKKQTAFLAAVTISFLPLLGSIFLLGEFPEVLSLLLLTLLLYSINTKRHFLVSVFTGLTILSHPFMALVAIILWLYNFKNLKKEKPKNILFYILILIIITSFWIPKYIQIMGNAASGTWHNSIYDTQQPYLAFWPANEIQIFLFGMHVLTPIILPLSIIGFLFTRNKLLRAFYIITLIFTIYHLPYTQLKVLDLFVIPSSILAALGLEKIINTSKKHNKHLPKAIAIFFILLMFSFQVTHFMHAKAYWVDIEKSPEIPLAESSLWLRDYNNGFVKIYSEQAPSWVGILSNKIPLEPYITDLEAYSDEYKEQLEYRKNINTSICSSDLVQLESLLKKHDIRFLFTKVNLTPDYLNRIHTNRGWNVYEVSL